MPSYLKKKNYRYSCGLLHDNLIWPYFVKALSSGEVMLQEGGKALTKTNKWNKKAERLGEGSVDKIFTAQVSQFEFPEPT